MDSLEGFTRRRLASEGTELCVAVGGPEDAPPVCLLHGFPETHLMWHRVAPVLARRFRVVCPDLRGYGDSGKPQGGPGHVNYSKRAMALDVVELMGMLGHDRFRLVGHDRGARVSHRLAIDHPDRVEKLVLMDIVPSSTVYGTVNQQVATAYFHWFFLIQRTPLPERYLGLDPETFLRAFLRGLGPTADAFPEAVLREYLRVLREPAAIHAMCEDYRAGATIDLAHEAEDKAEGRRIAAPTLILWGSRGLVGKAYDVMAVWREICADARGRALDCGHFLPEEDPDGTLAALEGFL